MGTGFFTAGGLVDFATSLYGAADDPMDTVMMRDGVAHGLLHAADSMAQVRVNYHPIAAGVAVDSDSFETIETSPAPTTGQWYRVGGAPFGPWPLTLRADGSGYKLRIRIGGALSSGTDTATFRVVIAPPRRLLTAEIEESEDHIFEATTASTTIAWLSGTAQGSSSPTVLTITAARAARLTRVREVYDAVSSATPHTVRQSLVAAHVFAKTSNVNSIPRLHALHLSEYVGT